MARSMTGFGRAVGEITGDAVTIELSSVNHKFADCSMRLPNGWAGLEPVVKQTVKKRVARGKVNILVNRKRAASARRAIRLDEDVARQYIESAQQLARMLGEPEDRRLPLDVLAQLNGVFCEEEPEEDLATVEEALVAVLVEAIENLNAARDEEGGALAADVANRVGLMRKSLAEVEARLPELNVRYETRLRERIADLGTDTSLTEERIAIEVALMAEKGDVTEEVVRLKTHLARMEEMTNQHEPIGREMDFLSQEIQREVNTLGVKTRDADVAGVIISMKAELGKIREQIQNIE